MKKFNHRHSKNNWSKVTGLLRPRLLQVIIIAICTIIIYATSLALPLAIQKSIDAILAQDTEKFYWTLGIAIAVSVIEITVSAWRVLTITNLGAYFELVLSAKLIKTILSRIYTTKELSPGNILNTTNQIQNIKNFILHTVPQSTLDLGQALISLLLIFTLNQSIALLITIILTISAFPLKSKTSRLPLDLNRHHDQENQKQNTISSIAFP